MIYWIGLGANLGDRRATIAGAARALASLGQIVARSRLYRSAPVGGPPQPPFLNAALALESAHDPVALLGELQRIEREAGRDRAQEERWGPRPLDLDVLLAGAHGEQLIDLPELVVPHPRLAERAFALAPLIELDASLVHPLAHRPLTELLARARASGQEVAPEP